MNWLRCYLDEKEPTLKEYAKIVRALTERVLDSSPRAALAALLRVPRPSEKRQRAGRALGRGVGGDARLATSC